MVPGIRIKKRDMKGVKQLFYPTLMSFDDSRVAESMWDDAEGGGLFEMT